MIFNGFKRKSIHTFVKKNKSELLKKLQANSDLSSEKNIESILIFLDADSDKTSIIQQLIGIFNIEETAITALTFVKKNSEKVSKTTFFSPSDFGRKGVIKSAELQNILTKNFDLLINYQKIDSCYTNLLILLCNSNFRIGFKQLDTSFYQLLINVEPFEIEQFNEEVEKYLRILKKIE